VNAPGARVPGVPLAKVIQFGSAWNQSADHCVTVMTTAVARLTKRPMFMRALLLAEGVVRIRVL